MYAIESGQPEISRVKREGLARFYGIDGGPGERVLPGPRGGRPRPRRGVAPADRGGDERRGRGRRRRGGRVRLPSPTGGCSTASAEPPRDARTLPEGGRPRDRDRARHRARASRSSCCSSSWARATRSMSPRLSGGATTRRDPAGAAARDQSPSAKPPSRVLDAMRSAMRIAHSVRLAAILAARRLRAPSAALPDRRRELVRRELAQAGHRYMADLLPPIAVLVLAAVARNADPRHRGGVAVQCAAQSPHRRSSRAALLAIYRRSGVPRGDSSAPATRRASPRCSATAAGSPCRSPLAIGALSALLASAAREGRARDRGRPRRADAASRRARRARQGPSGRGLRLLFDAACLRPRSTAASAGTCLVRCQFARVALAFRQREHRAHTKEVLQDAIEGCTTRRCSRVVIVAAVVVFVVLKNDNSDESSDTAKGVQVLHVDQSGDPVGGVKTLTYNKGDQVQLARAAWPCPRRRSTSTATRSRSPAEHSPVDLLVPGQPRRRLRGRGPPPRQDGGADRRAPRQPVIGCAQPSSPSGLAAVGPAAVLWPAGSAGGASLPGCRLGARAGRPQGPAGAGLALRLGGLARPDHLLRAALGRLDPGAPAEGGLAADRRAGSRARVLNPGTEVLCGLIGVGLFVVVLYAGFRGIEDPTQNFSIIFVFYTFWLGLVLLSVLLRGRLPGLQPVARDRAASSPVASAWSRDSRAPVPFRYPEWLGRWPAVLGVLLFVWLELIAGGGVAPTPHDVAVGDGRSTAWSPSSAWRCSGSRSGSSEARPSTPISGCSPGSARSRRDGGSSGAGSS